MRIATFFFFLLILKNPLSAADLQKTVTILTRELKATYAQVYRDRAKEKLIELGSDAVPYLGKILKQNDDTDVSLSILEIFEEIHDPQSASQILEFLDQTDSVDLISQSIKALGRLKSPSATQRLTLILKNAPENYFFEQDIYKIVATTLWALSEVGDSSAVDTILDFAKSYPKPYYLSFCAKALGKIGDEKAVPFLIDWVKYHDREVRSNAVEALSKFVTPAMSKFLWIAYENENESEVKSLLMDLIVKVAKDQDIHKMISMLRSGQDYNSQRIADQCLKKMGEKAVPALITVLNGDSDPEQKINGIRILSDFCSSGAVSQLILMAEQKNPVIQVAAIEALEKCGDPSALHVLGKLSFSFNKTIRKAASSAKEKIALRTEQTAPRVP